jgi:hypothetical protein
MQKDELWKIYTEKNPDFLTGPVKFTSKGLKKFFDQKIKRLYIAKRLHWSRATCNLSVFLPK